MLKAVFSKLWDNIGKRKDTTTKPKYAFTSLWVQDTLPDHVRLCINSFLRNGHSYTLFTYGKLSIPGVTVLDARDILSEQDIFRDRATKSLAPFSDLFRWKYLYETGGTWVDADLACISDKPLFLHPLDAQEEQQPYFCYEDATNNYIGASCIQLPKHSRIAEYMYRLSYNPLTSCPWETADTYRKKFAYYNTHATTYQRKKCQEIVPWAYTSTLGLTKAIKYVYGDRNVPAKPSTAIYPVYHREAHRLYDGSMRLDDINREDTWAIHLWGHELAMHNYSIHTPTPSLMTDLLQAYGLCDVD